MAKQSREQWEADRKWLVDTYGTLFTADLAYPDDVDVEDFPLPWEPAITEEVLASVAKSELEGVNDNSTRADWRAIALQLSIKLERIMKATGAAKQDENGRWYEPGVFEQK